MLPITYEDVASAAERLEGVAHRTPVMTSRTADEMSGAKIFFKCENFQRMGAFKFRGAYNALSHLTDEQKKRGVVSFSSGNHAQAVALSGRLLGVETTIVMPHDAPKAKVAATKGYGANVIFYDRYKESRDEIAGKLRDERGLSLIPPFNHVHVMAGQGTAAKELIEDVGPLDMVFTPLGGGGLLSGTAVAVKGICPSCRVFGVEPEAGNDAQQSFKSGSIVTIPTPKTIADGAQTVALGPLTFAVIRELVTDVLTATDGELMEMMRFFAARMKMVVEPTGCLAAARAMTGGEAFRGKRIGVILSGGNVDLPALAGFLGA